MRVKDLPLDDQPREKLYYRGPDSLSDAELLAILLRTGTAGKSVLNLAREIIKEFRGLPGLAEKQPQSLMKIKGIGKEKAAILSACFEICRRVTFQEKLFSKSKITSPSDIAEIFIPLLRDDLKESFLIVCLNSANKIIKYERISVGTLNSSIVHPREVFKVAIECSSANIILIHNHPSGNCEPSGEDIAITKKLRAAGKALDIEVFDHIIVAGNSFFSFVESRII